MKRSLLEQALKAKALMEERFTPDDLLTDPIYQELLDLIRQYNSGLTSGCRTDIGVAVVRTYDSDRVEDKAFTKAISELAWMHNRHVINEKLGISAFVVK